jgi:hypothetical protein
VKDAFEQKSVEKPLVEFTTEESEEKPSFVAPNDDELDLGKEIFLSNLQENSQVVTETDNFDAVDEIATSSSLNADDLSASVSAILAASEEAAVAAEASLPADIAD